MLSLWNQYQSSSLSGRNRRLWHEWRQIDECLSQHPVIHYQVVSRNGIGLPVCYLIDYQLRSICGVGQVERLDEPGVDNAPLFARGFMMKMELPVNYPCVDAPPSLYFLTADDCGRPIPHPWHPNIRYFGEFAGRVCINMTDTYTSLLWGIERVASYLRYETYHAVNEPPYPEDLKVANWVRRQGEPNGWIYFDQ